MKRYCTRLVLIASILLVVASAPAYAGGGQPVVQPAPNWGNPSRGWRGPTPAVREQPGVFGAHRDPWADWPPRRDFDRDRDGGHRDGFGHPGMRVGPRQDVVWVPGFWGWTAYGWAWVPGHWAVAP